jgi:hypothetical protein
MFALTLLCYQLICACQLERWGRVTVDRKGLLVDFFILICDVLLWYK